MKIVNKIIRYLAFERGHFRGLYIRLCQPMNDEYAEYLKKWGGLHSMGEKCRVNLGVAITDPAYVKIGNNVTLTDCALIGHDGVIAMLNIAYGKKLDSVGKIDIRDNCFIGHWSIIMPGVTIGPNAVVAAGAVVIQDVEPGTIVGGVPAKPIGRVEDLVNRLELSTSQLPWAELILGRDGGFDSKIEPQLVAARVKYFFPD